MRNKQGYVLVEDLVTGKRHVGKIEGEMFFSLIKSVNIPLNQIDLSQAYECSQKDADVFEADAKYLDLMKKNLVVMDQLKEQAQEISKKLASGQILTEKDLTKLDSLKQETLDFFQRVSHNH